MKLLNVNTADIWFGGMMNVFTAVVNVQNVNNTSITAIVLNTKRDSW